MKFVHIMSMGNSLYNQECISIINEFCNLKEHLFICNSKELSNLYSKKGNVIYDSKIKQVSYLKKYFNIGEYIVFHSLFLKPLDYIRFSNKEINKIIWCIWGHDLYFYNHNSLGVVNLKSFFKKILKEYAILKLKNINKFVIGFEGDRKTLYSIFGSRIQITNALYSSGFYLEDIEKIRKINKKNTTTKTIMIGHSAYPFLQHQRYLDVLSKYVNEDIRIILPLTYGNLKYADEISKYAEDKFPNKLTLLFKSMSLPEYIKLLDEIDIAIFDYTHQSALSNLFYLLYLGKKIYLNFNGVIAQEFIRSNLMIFDCNKISSLSYLELFDMDFPTKENVKYSSSQLSKINISNMWRDLFESL